MKLIIEGVDYYWEDYHPELFGTYAVEGSKTIDINYIPSIKKAEKLFKRHVCHKEAESFHLTRFTVTDNDGKNVYAYYDGYSIYRFNEMSVDECNKLISQADEVSRLHGQGSYELGWDNFSTARSLHAQADKLKNMIALAKTALAFNYSINCVVI